MIIEMVTFLKGLNENMHKLIGTQRVLTKY